MKRVLARVKQSAAERTVFSLGVALRPQNLLAGRKTITRVKVCCN